MLYLTDAPCTEALPHLSGWCYDWDGAGRLTLYHTGEARSTLRFLPGDAVRVFYQNGIVKLTKVTEPASRAAAVLWFIGVERDFRCRDLSIFDQRVQRVRDRYQARPGEDFTLMDWRRTERVPWRSAQGDRLYLLAEPDLRLARLADARGRKWADLAAWCDPEIDRDRALGHILRLRTDDAPLWYIRKVLEQT